MMIMLIIMMMIMMMIMIIMMIMMIMMLVLADERSYERKKNPLNATTFFSSEKQP